MEDNYFSPAYTTATTPVFDLHYAGCSPALVDPSTGLPYPYSHSVTSPSFVTEIHQKRADTVTAMKADGLDHEEGSLEVEIPKRKKGLQRLSLASSIASSASSTTPSESDGGESNIFDGDNDTFSPIMEGSWDVDAELLSADFDVVPDLIDSRSNLALEPGSPIGDETNDINSMVNDFTFADFIKDTQQSNLDSDLALQAALDNAKDIGLETGFTSAFVTPQRPAMHKKVTELAVGENLRKSTMSLPASPVSFEDAKVAGRCSAEENSTFGHLVPRSYSFAGQGSHYSFAVPEYVPNDVFSSHPCELGDNETHESESQKEAADGSEVSSFNPTYDTPQQSKVGGSVCAPTSPTVLRALPFNHPVENGAGTETVSPFGSPQSDLGATWLGMQAFAARPSEPIGVNKSGRAANPTAEDQIPGQTMTYSQSAPAYGFPHMNMFGVLKNDSPTPSSPAFSARSNSPFQTPQHGQMSPSVMQQTTPFGHYPLHHMPQQLGSPLSHPLHLRGLPAHLIYPYSGVITKRSRGRRVPSKPEEMNNLGKSGKVYTCKVPGCGKCFKRSEHLKRHVRSIHTDDKPFMCPFPGCRKRFSRHDNLNQHARVHSTTSSGAPGSVTDFATPPLSQSGSMSPVCSPLTLPAATFGQRFGDMAGSECLQTDGGNYSKTTFPTTMDEGAKSEALLEEAFFSFNEGDLSLGMKMELS